MTGYPPAWRRSTLGELGLYLNGRGFKKNEWATTGRPIIRIQNLTGSSDNFNFFEGDVEDRYIARPGDLLVSWAATLGAYIWNGPEGVVNQHIFKVQSNIDKLFHKYLLEAKLAELMTHTHGSGMVHITRGRFDSLPVMLPPLAEQQRIVAILEEHLSSLDAADRYLTSASKRVDGLWAALLESNFGAALSARVPLASYVSSIFAGKSLGASTPPARLDEWGIIKVSAMTRGDFRETENKAVPTDRIDPRREIHAGDLLVSRANTADYVGASVLVPQGVRPRLLLSDKSLRIVPAEGVRVEWLWRALQTPSARQQISQLATGTKDSMRNISQPSLLRVLVPNADPAEQVAAVASFAEHAECVERQSQALRSAQSRASDLRRALLSAAFSGRLTGRSSDCQLIEELADQEAS